MALSQQEGAGAEGLMPPSGWDENGNWTGKRSSGFGGLARSSASQAVPKAPSLIESRGANSLHGFDKEVLREPGESNRDFGRRLAVLQHTPKTANDYWGEFEWSDLVPYWSSGADVVEMKGLYDAVSRIDEGAGTPDDEKQVLSWLLDMNRPTTFGYKVADIGVGSIPFMGEMALSGGVSSLVKSGGMKVLRTGLEKAAAELGERAIGKVAGKMAKKVATKQLDDVLARGAGEVAERGALSALGRGALRTGEITATSEMISSMVGEGGRIEANTYGRALPDMGIAADPQDASRLLVMMDGSIGSFTDALPEGALEALFETGSEMMGGVLTKYSALDRLRGFQLKIFSDLKHSGKWSRRMQKGLEAGQWHGIVGEWLEERANAAMQAATPGMFEEAGWLDVIPSIEQGLAEVVAFGATGGAMHGGGLALDKMLEPAAVEQRGEGFLGGRPQGAAPATQQKPLTQPEQVANKLGRAVSDMETQNGVRYQPVAAEEDPRVGSLERALARVGVDLVVVAPSAEAGAAEADAGSDASERRVPVPAMWAAEGVVVLDSSVLDSPGATEALIAHEVEVHNNLEQARTRGEDALAPLLDVLEAASPGLLAEYRSEYARRYESSEQAQRGAEIATAAEAREAAEELIDAGDQHGGVALWGGYVRSQGARTDGDVQILDLMPSQKIIDAQSSERPALAKDALSEEAVATAAEQGFLRNLRAVLRTAKGQKLARQLYAGNRTKLQQLVDAIKGVVRRLGITLETREAAALRKLEQLLVAKIPANVDSREAVEAARALEQFVGIAEQRRTAEQATPPTARGQQAESQPATSEVATPLVAPAPPEQAPEPEMASLPQAVAPQAVEAQENAPASDGGVAEMPRTAPNMFGETEERALERPEVAEEATQTGQLFQDDTGARGQTSILDTQESVPTPAVQPEAQAVQPEAPAVQPEAQAMQPEAQAVQPESEEPAPAKTREPKKPLTPQQKKVNRRIAGRKAFKARVARYAAAEEGVRFVQWLRAKGGVNLSQGDLSDYTDPAYAHYNDGGIGLPRAVHKHGMTVDRLWEEIRDAGWFAAIGRHDLQPGYSTGETYNESESRAADVAVLMQLLDENPTKRESEEWIEEAEEAYNQAQYDQYDAQFYDALGDVAEANGYSDALHEGLQKAYQEERISYTQVADLLEGSGMSAEAAQALLDEAQAKPRFALAPGSPAELDAQGQQRLEEALRQSPNGDVVRSLLEEYANTPWARQAIKGAQARAALDLLLSGETPEFESVFGAPGQRALAEAIRNGGAEVIWNRLAQNSIIGHPSKPLNAVNASFLNCEPTLECASSCYAANGMAARAGNVVKAELVEWAVRTDPVRAGKLAATQYKGMGEFFKKKALRLFDKGDGQMYWVPFIKALNAEGVRTQVFSKHAEFLRQVPSLNLRLYSVDAQNMEAARAESDLPVAFVYTGTDAEVDWIREHSDRVQVVLPIKMGAKTLDAALQAKLEQGAAGITPKICPVDRGKVKIGKDASGPLKENWDCTRCDQGGGVGCFYKNTTSQVLKASRSIEDTIQEANDEWKATVRQVAKALDGPARSDVLAELDALLRQARGNSDSEAEAGFDPRAAGAARRSRGGEAVHRGGSQRGDAQGDQLDAYDPKFAVAPSTDSPEFQRWFESSKVVDAEGKPLVVYHGTSVPGGFTQFSREHLRSEHSFYFTADPEEASYYSEDSPTGLMPYEGGRPQVLPVYLLIKNPYPGHHLAKADEDYDGHIEYGPDGSILWATVDDPEQIKSAIGNRGTYDPADPDLRRAVTAYHGTLPEFDSFSTDKINTGERTQWYGWGLYFASRKLVAEHYRRQQSGGGLRAQLDGKDTSRDSRPEEIPAYAWGVLGEGNLDKAIGRLRRDMEWYAGQVGDEEELWTVDDPAELAQRLADSLRWLEENRDRISYRQAGAGYTVELAPEEDEYLLWDRPLAEQSVKVQEALGWNQSARDFSDEMKRIFRDYLGSGDPARIAEGNRLIEEANRRPRHPLTDPIGSRHEAKGYFAYEELSRIKGSPKDASLYLHSQGVRGIKYLDGNSRSDGEGSYNYVIFDDADVRVTGRWAIAEPASGGVAPRVATAFSGMGTVEAALGAESVLAVELDAAVVEAHNQAHGSKWKPEDVLALNPARIAAEDPDLFHASPVCKNCSTAKRGATIDKSDLAAGRKIAQVIREARPRAVTVENVPAYRHTIPYRLIVKALEEEGYFWDADLYNAAEYGGAQSRSRLIVRARRDRPLPPMPAKRPAADWYDLIKDLLPDAKLSRLPKWERQRIDAMAEKGLLDLASPVLTMGSSGFSGRANAVNAGQPAPTLVSSEKSVPRILLPDGRTVRVSGRMMARLMGLADSVQVPTSDRLAKRVLGNGVHGVISRDVIGPVADIKGQPRFALEDLNRPPERKNQESFAYVGQALERAAESLDEKALTSGLNALNQPPERKKQQSLSYLEEALKRATTPSGGSVREADPSTQIDIDPDNLPMLGDRVHLEEVFNAWLGNRQVAEEWAKSQAARRERELIGIVDELAPRGIAGVLRESASAEPNRVAVREMDEAIHLWIDLGDRAEEQFAKWGGKLTDRQRRVYELSQNLPPAVRELAESIRAENQARGRLLKDAGVIQSIVDGYSARIWEAGTDGISIPFGLGRFKLNTDRAKEREFESTLHGWAKGRELRVKGAIGSQLAARLETAQVLHDRNLLETAKRYRVISSKQHEGWERVEHPNFRPWKIVGKMPAAEWESMSPQEREEQFATYSSDLMITESGEVLARQDAYAPKQLARALNNALGKSMLMDIGWIRALTRAQAKLKATILYTSLFHHQAYLRSYGLATEAFDGDLKNLNPYEAMRRGREAIERFGPEVQDLVRAGLTIGSTRDLEEDLLEEQTIIGRVIDKVPGAAEFSHTLEAMRRQQTNYLFHRMGPQLKIQAALLDYRHRLHVNRAELEAGTITRREIATAIAEKVNNDFGGLNLQRLKISPTNWHIARLFLLAPDWTYSNVRSMVQAFRRGEVGRVHRALWGAVAVRGLIATVGFNLLMAAMPTDDDKDKRFTRRFLGRYQRAWDEGHMRWLDADVTPLYELFAQGEGKRKYFSLIGHFRDPVKFLGNPVRSLKHKASPGASAVYEALSGTDWAGRQFTTTPELLGMDDKGVYASSRKGKDGKYVYRKGDPKGGKLAGQTVSWKSESRGPINFTNLPSFTIARTKAALPVQVQNLLAFVAGEQDAFDTITKSMGLMTSTTRPKEED